jgi:hypothetical protein
VIAFSLYFSGMRVGRRVILIGVGSDFKRLALADRMQAGRKDVR